MNFNQMALHTTSGCFTTNQIQQTGALGATNCSDGSGCTVRETKPNSFGAGFAGAGGGVWATQFDVSGIYMWFWSVSVPFCLLCALRLARCVVLALGVAARGGREGEARGSWIRSRLHGRRGGPPGWIAPAIRAERVRCG